VEEGRRLSERRVGWEVPVVVAGVGGVGNGNNVIITLKKKKVRTAGLAWCRYQYKLGGGGL